LFFKGEAKEIFKKYQNNPEAIQSIYAQQQEQNKANEALLAKLSTGEIATPNHLFKRRLLDV
jgi:hypothetical protein